MRFHPDEVVARFSRSPSSHVRIHAQHVLLFPKRMQGTALGLQAGIGNFGVSLVQLLTPWLIGTWLLFKKNDTWLITILYIMAFGTFSGLAAQLSLPGGNP